MLKNFSWLLLLLASFHVPAFSQVKKTYDLVKDFGARADDRTDCYAAFLKAAEVISRAGGGTLNIPFGKYYIASYKIHGGDDANKITDIIFMNCKGLIIRGNNSKIRINGNFTRTNGYQSLDRIYKYSYRNTVAPFYFVNCKDVLLSDIILDGGVLQMKKESGVVEGQCYGVRIDDEKETDVSSRIIIKNVTANHFAADGFLIKSNGDDISILNCKAKNNARQGISIVKGHNIKCYNSEFDSTGSTGAYGWHMPGAGIDVENEFGTGQLKDVVIRNCSMRFNKGFQIVTTLSSENVLIDSCFIADPTNGYSDGLQGVGMYSLNSTISNCIIFGSIQIDIADQIYKGPVLQQFNRNIIYSGFRGIISSDFNRPSNITENILIMLPNSAAEYFPYIRNANGFYNTNIVVMESGKVRKQPNSILALVQDLKQSRNNFWLISKSRVTVAEQKKYYYVPALGGPLEYNIHFLPDNDWLKTRADAACCYNFISQEQEDEILKASLFTAFKQKSLNVTYLAEAEKTRKYVNGIITTVKPKNKY